MYALSVATLSLAIALQLFAAVAALTQIRHSGPYWPYWGSIAAALALMVLRRAGPLEAELANRGTRLEAFDQSLIGLAISVCMAIGVFGLRRLFRELETQKKALTQLSREDALTKLWNRRHTLELAMAEFDAARRFGRHLSMMMIDIDHFKRVNDSLGHEAGDRTLAAAARRIQEYVRAVDKVGRLGGEEFLVVLPETSLDEAIKVAGRLREGFHAPWETPLPPITVSIGVAEIAPTDPDVAALIGRSDAALYRAKEAGRDRMSA